MKITIYSKPACPQCDQAKMLLTSRSMLYEEVIIDVGQEKVANKRYILPEELKKMIPGVKTVPQIFLDDVLLGGLIELRRELSK